MCQGAAPCASRALTARPLPNSILLKRGLHVSVDPGLPLQPQLARLEDKLEASLDEVCAETNIRNVDTGELIKIEETLAIAAEAAKEAVSLRRRLRHNHERSSEEGRHPEA